MVRLASFFVTALLASTALADPIFSLGNNPQADEQNILFTTNQTGPTVFGFTNQTSTEVSFSSTTDTLNVTANGQANLTATDGYINDVKVALYPTGTFQDMILDPQGPNCIVTATIDCKPAGQVTTQAQIIVVASDGTFDYNLTIGNGDNFFTLIAAAGEVLDSVEILSNSLVTALGFENLKQPRISGIGPDPVPVPEPSTLALLGVALLGVFGLHKAGRYTHTMHA